MRKWICLMSLLVILVGCSKKDDFTVLIENIAQQDFVDESDYVNCQLDVTQISENLYRYRVVINQTKMNLKNIKAFVICNHAAENTVPSIGFSENDNCHLYIDKIDVSQGYYEGISLMGLCKELDVECQLYLSYEIDDQVYEEYIVLRGR